jgi:transposase
MVVMVKCGQLVQPLINLIHEKILEQGFLHMDETQVQVLNEPNKAVQSNSYMWVLRSTLPTASAVLFRYEPTRSGDSATKLLCDFTGALMVDGYEGYSAACAKNSITRLGCWAHARRKFIEAQQAPRGAGRPKGKTGKADQALAYIQQLYRVEQSISDKTADEKYQTRQQQSQPILDKLKSWLDKSLPQMPPKTALGKALYYLDSQWLRLTNYMQCGDYPIDNNAAENAIRPFVIGRKNWLFSASQHGATASANLYSLIETAKANGLESYTYLKRIFTELPNVTTVEQIENLLPWNLNNNE